MRVRIDESGKQNALAKIDNFRIARFFFDLIAQTDDVDLAIANQDSAVANDSELGQFFTDSRMLWSGKRDELGRVKKSERLQTILLCTT